jgi:hypothetical protein
MVAFLGHVDADDEIAIVTADAIAELTEFSVPGSFAIYHDNLLVVWIFLLCQSQCYLEVIFFSRR